MDNLIQFIQFIKKKTRYKNELHIKGLHLLMKCQRNGIKYREKNRYVHLFKEYRLIHEILELKINNEFFEKSF